MADTKLVDLDPGNAEGTDIVYAVKDPSGVPLDRKIALSNIKDYILGGSPPTFTDAITVRSTDTGANAAPDVILYRDSSSPADNDIIGQIKFDGEDSAGNQQTYGTITGQILDEASTSEDGALLFGVVTAGTVANEVRLDGSALSPATSDGNALGTSSLMWSDLFLASGGVVNFNNGDVTITHGADTLTVAGGDLRSSTAGTDTASVVTVGGTQTLTNKTLTNCTGFPGVNVLINGCFRVNQRAPASNADDTYAHDRWNILTQTSTVAVTGLTLVENTTPNMMRVTQSQVTAQRFGVAQIVEATHSYPLRGQAVTLSARVRCSASTTLRFAILEWTGTANSVTSDVVSDWTSGTYTAGNFFLSSNLTVTATSSQALTASTLTSVSLTGTLGSSTNNVIVLFWTDSTQAQNVTLDIGKAQLEIGSVATLFERVQLTDVLRRCYRYFQALKPYLTSAYGPGIQATATSSRCTVPCEEMRTTPTLIIPSGVGSTFSVYADGSTYTPSAVVVQDWTGAGYFLEATISGGPSGHVCTIAAYEDWQMSAEL